MEGRAEYLFVYSDCDIKVVRETIDILRKKGRICAEIQCALSNESVSVHQHFESLVENKPKIVIFLSLDCSKSKSFHSFYNECILQRNYEWIQCYLDSEDKLEKEKQGYNLYAAGKSRISVGRDAIAIANAILEEKYSSAPNTKGKSHIISLIMVSIGLFASMFWGYKVLYEANANTMENTKVMPVDDTERLERLAEQAAHESTIVLGYVSAPYDIPIRTEPSPAADGIGILKSGEKIPYYERLQGYLTYIDSLGYLRVKYDGQTGYILVEESMTLETNGDAKILTS